MRIDTFDAKPIIFFGKDSLSYCRSLRFISELKSCTSTGIWQGRNNKIDLIDAFVMTMKPQPWTHIDCDKGRPLT